MLPTSHSVSASTSRQGTVQDEPQAQGPRVRDRVHSDINGGSKSRLSKQLDHLRTGAWGSLSLARGLHLGAIHSAEGTVVVLPPPTPIFTKDLLSLFRLMCTPCWTISDKQCFKTFTTDECRWCHRQDGTNHCPVRCIAVTRILRMGTSSTMAAAIRHHVIHRWTLRWQHVDLGLECYAGRT